MVQPTGLFLKKRNGGKTPILNLGDFRAGTGGDSSNLQRGR